MEKVKIFSRVTQDIFDLLEIEINQWLEKNNSIKIIDRKIALTNVLIFNVSCIYCTITIFYKDS
jgi:hypothetical protein